jgi:hypothetical protein
MNRIRRSLLCELLLAFALAMSSQPAALAQPRCRTAVAIVGPTDMVAALSQLLQRRGVQLALDSHDPPGCPTLRVVVSVDGTGLNIVLSQGVAASHDHHAANAEDAATQIESWIDLSAEAPLLVGHTTVAVPAVATVVDHEKPPVIGSVTAASPPQVSMVAAVTPSIAFDGSAWIGLVVGGCVMLGKSCVGATTRIATDTQQAGASERLETQRLAADLLLSFEIPVEVAGTPVVVGAGVGLGWLGSSAVASTDNPDQNSGGMRAELHAAAELPISSKISVELRASLGLSPFAHVNEFVDNGTSLAGEPRGFGGIAVGLRYGHL